jgi:phosphoribosylamine---glycine ligase
MKVVVVGKGGREHALVKALKMDSEVLVHPGNVGVLETEDNVHQIALRGFGPEPETLARACVREGVDLVVIGPEAELVSGLADDLRQNGIQVFGPGARAAQLEGSKIFAKDFMSRHGIPTARALVVNSVLETLTGAKELGFPCVLKADGLCAGKGVFVCNTRAELEAAAAAVFEKKIFGLAGERALLEEGLSGPEVSLFVLTNGVDDAVLPSFRDHKRALDGDRGPNTGGMGVFGPLEFPIDLQNEIKTAIVRPTVRGLSKDDLPYRGVLFIGLMLTPSGPKVLEYNVRFGDPETQCLLPLLQGNWSRVFAEVAAGRVPELNWRPDKVTCVVLAASGYPLAPKLHRKVEFQPKALNSQTQYALWAGVSMNAKEGLVTDGGRVANAIGIGPTQAEATRRAYEVVGAFKSDGLQWRTDIGREPGSATRESS